MLKKIFFVLLFLVYSLSGMARAGMIGVNISGSEYSWETYPIKSHLDYLESKGIALIRLPVAWEKLQSKPNGQNSEFGRGRS